MCVCVCVCVGGVAGDPTHSSRGLLLHLEESAADNEPSSSARTSVFSAAHTHKNKLLTWEAGSERNRTHIPTSVPSSKKKRKKERKKERKKKRFLSVMAVRSRTGYYRQEVNRTAWEVPERYRDLKQVGTGAYGTVWWVRGGSDGRVSISWSGGRSFCCVLSHIETGDRMHSRPEPLLSVWWSPRTPVYSSCMWETNT